MSLVKYAAVAALGYYLGQPAGRRQLDRLRERGTELWQSPKAREVKERSWDVAGERVSAVTKAVSRRKRDNVVDEPVGAPVATTAAGPSEDLQTGVLPPAADRPVR